MAKKEMQCRKCRGWITVGEYQLYVPNHGESKTPKDICSGSGKVAYDTKGWARGAHPPSIVKGTGA